MKKTIATLLAATSLMATLPAEETAKEVGFVNFTNCKMQSKVGKHEQEAMDQILANMRELIQDREKGLKELQEKFTDADYMDGLNPAAAEEMKGQYQALQEEYGRYQQQYMQVAQQAQMKMMQNVHEHARIAAEKIARVRKLDYIIPTESILYCASNLDITNEVVAEMDKEFELNRPKGSVQ